MTDNVFGDERPDGDASLVRLVDLRYGYTLDPLDGLWGVRARYGTDGELLAPPERYQNRPDVNGETIGQLMSDAFPGACTGPQSLSAVGRGPYSAD